MAAIFKASYTTSGDTIAALMLDLPVTSVGHASTAGSGVTQEN